MTVASATPTAGFSRDLPRVFGESAYDRVTSLLLAVVLGAFLVVGWWLLILVTIRAYDSRVARPVQIIEVAGGGGGRPEGQIGGVETVNVPGGAAADQASNNEEEAPDFEEPSVEARPAALLDAATEAGQELAEVDIGAVMPNGGRVASGKRRSKVGNGAPGFGYGPGDGGISREDRWSISYKTGQTPDEYARQLDALGVELAIVSGNQLAYYSHFSQAKPDRRLGSGANDRRLYFVWRGQGRKESDLALLAKAGAEVGEGVIFQFYPEQVENVLAQLEVRFKGRQPGEIRSTKFGVVEQGSSYGFEVISQEPLR